MFGRYVLAHVFGAKSPTWKKRKPRCISSRCQQKGAIDGNWGYKPPYKWPYNMGLTGVNYHPTYRGLITPWSCKKQGETCWPMVMWKSGCPTCKQSSKNQNAFKNSHGIHGNGIFRTYYIICHQQSTIPVGKCVFSMDRMGIVLNCSLLHIKSAGRLSMRWPSNPMWTWMDLLPFLGVARSVLW